MNQTPKPRAIQFPSLGVVAAVAVGIAEAETPEVPQIGHSNLYNIGALVYN